MIVGWLEITLVLLGLYFLESLYWLHFGGIAFLTNWSVLRPVAPSDWHSRSGSPRWGPAAPFGLRLLTQEWPFALSPEGILGGLPIPYTDSFTSSDAVRQVSFEEVWGISSHGRTLYVNELPFVTLQTSRLAADFASRLQEIWKSDREARASRIRDWIAQRLDISSLKDRAAVLSSGLFHLRWFSLLLTVYLLVLVPVVVLRETFELTWPWLLLGWMILIGTHSFLFIRANRRILRFGRSELLRSVLLHLCAPMTATRAHVHLTQESFVSYDPLIVAFALSTEDARCDMLRAAVFRRIPPGQEESPIAHWFHQETLRLLTALLGAESPSLSSSLCGPSPDSAVSASYCPRCLSQYVIDSGRCAACNIALVRFNGTPFRWSVGRDTLFV